MKSLLTGKDPDAGKDQRQKERRATEDEMVGKHHQLNGHEFEQTLGGSEGWEAWVLQSLGSLGVEHDVGMNNNNNYS